MDNKKTVILIEDEPFIRDLYQRTLEQIGLSVLIAGDGASALQLIKQLLGQGVKIDLILLDIMLPKLNGIEVLKRLKGDPVTSALRVLLITNLGAGEIIKQAFSIGAEGYMMKANLTPYDVVEEVKRFLSDPSYKMDLSGIDFD